MSLIKGYKKSHDLALLHEECELNYRRLLRVLLKPRQVDSAAWLFAAEGAEGSVELRVVEVTRYTSLVQISAAQSGPVWLDDIDIKVRVYRDAQMVEVVEWNRDRTIPWVLSESSAMYARDEKWQWNLFLSELLSHGLRCSSRQIKASH
ncbi:MAG: DUF1249 domain-containing protein [Porticoccaceae bacterium]|nr:DUF1249 domain-containing protein [Porticoccaceae bacterium]